MNGGQPPKTPLHLWIIAVLAILWNAIGAFSYTATEMRLGFYMSQFNQAQLDYIHAFPAWVIAAWAIAVWCSLLASLGLLLRRSWATWLFGIAIIGLAATSVYSFVLHEGMKIMGEGQAVFTAVIWVVALFLYFYSAAMTKRRVLA